VFVCTGCKVASTVSEVALTSGDWEVDSKQVIAILLPVFCSLLGDFWCHC